jgi:hypothetical protein
MISAFGSRWTPGTSGWSIIPTCTPWFPAAALPRMASAGREDGWRHPRGRDKPYLVDNRVLSACVRDKFVAGLTKSVTTCDGVSRFPHVGAGELADQSRDPRSNSGARLVATPTGLGACVSSSCSRGGMI